MTTKQEYDQKYDVQFVLGILGFRPGTGSIQDYEKAKAAFDKYVDYEMCGLDRDYAMQEIARYLEV